MDSDQWGTRGKGQAVATVQKHFWKQLRAGCRRELEVWASLAHPDLRISYTWQEALVVAVGFDCAAGFV